MHARTAYFRRLLSGAAIAQIDDGDTFVMARRQADLFEILIQDGHENDGELIDLKEPLYVLCKLSRPLGARMKEGTLRTRLCRLRGTLEAAGYGRELVQVTRDGMRIRLLRGA